MSIAYKALAGLLLLIAVGSGGYWFGSHNAYNAQQVKYEALQTKDALALAASNKQLADEQASARAQEQASAQHLATVIQTYEEDKAHAKAQSDATIAALRAGTLRLRDEWTSCAATATSNVPEAASGRSSTSDAAQLRYEDASHLVLYADQADAEIRALQAIVKQDRQ